MYPPLNPNPLNSIRDDLKLPEDESLAKKIKTGFDDGDDVQPETHLPIRYPKPMTQFVTRNPLPKPLPGTVPETLPETHYPKRYPKRYPRPVSQTVTRYPLPSNQLPTPTIPVPVYLTPPIW